jgi:hypothetical protein
LFSIQIGVARSTYGPTLTHREQLSIVTTELVGLSAELEAVRVAIVALGEALLAAGAPSVEG